MWRGTASKSVRRGIAIGFAGLVLNCVFFGPWTLRSAFLEIEGALPYFGDFTHFYVGACMAGTDAEYDRETVLREQTRLTGSVQLHLLPSRLPFYYGFLRPLCSLSYVSAHRTWMVFILLAAVAATVLLYFSQGEIAIAASLGSAALFISILGSQDDSLLFLVLAAGLWLRKAGRPVSAGLVFSLLLIKFHLFLLLPLLFLIKREFRLAAGALSGSAALLAISFALAGKDWPAKYAAVLRNPVLGPGTEAMPNLHGLSSHFASATTVEALLTIVVVAISIWIVVRSPFSVAFGAALVGSMLISRHAYASDCLVLVPGLVAIWQEGKSFAAKIAFVCLLPVPYWLMENQKDAWVTTALLILLLLALTKILLTAGTPKNSEVSRPVAVPFNS